MRCLYFFAIRTDALEPPQSEEKTSTPAGRIGYNERAVGERGAVCCFADGRA